MKKVLIASMVAVSLLLLASGAMANCGSCKEDVCPPIEICIPDIPVCNFDVCIPDLPCNPDIKVDFPDICCPEIKFDIPEFNCPETKIDFPEICPEEKPCPEPEPPCPPR